MSIDKDWIKRMEIRSKDYKNMLYEIEEYIDLLEKDKNEFRKKLQDLESIDNVADEKLKIENERLENDLQNAIILTAIERKRFDEFRQKHYEQCGNGSKVIIELTFTGIGTVIKLTCPVCGEIENITEDCW